MDKKFAKDIFKEVIDKSHLNGAVSDANKFLQLVDKKDRYKNLYFISPFVKYFINGKEKKAKVKDILKHDFDIESLVDEISTEFSKNPKNSTNKWALKILDMILYGLDYMK